MQVTKDSEAQHFLNRFSGFSDAVVQSLSLQFSNDGSRLLELKVVARDTESQENEGWVGVTIRIRSIVEVMVRESPKTTIQVLSQGVNVFVLNGNFAFEFGGAADPPNSLFELQSSDAYAIGKDFSFEVFPYS